jgi:hemoglobin-like flavoprotein
MTPEQIDLVQETFAELAPAGDAVAELLFHHLLELDPTLDFLCRRDVRDRGRKLMQALATAVSALQRRDALRSPLWVGVRAAAIGLRAHDCETVKEALMLTVRQVLGIRCTGAVMEAWAETALLFVAEMRRIALRQRGVTWQSSAA